MDNVTPEQFQDALAIENHEKQVPEPVRHEAHQFLTRLRASPQGRSLAYEIIANERYNPHRVFWAFNTLIDHIPIVAPDTSPEAAQQLYSALRHWIGHAAGADVPDYILAKHAQVCAVGMQAFFPERWPNFFRDLFDIVDREMNNVNNNKNTNQVDEQMILYVLKVWMQIHFCVADPRTDAFHAQRDRNNFVKDEMRKESVPRAVHIWYKLLMRYGDVKSLSNTRYSADIPKTCLDLLAIFSEWIDIDLLIRDEMVQMYYGYIMHVPGLRDESLEVLAKIVDKGQVPELKLRTIQQLLLIERLPTLLDSSGDLCEENERFLGILSKLVVVMLQELLKINNPDAERMGHALIPVLLRLIQQHPLEYIREIVVPQLQDYVKLSCATKQELYEISNALFNVACTEVCHGWIAEGNKQAEEENIKTLFNVFRLVHRKAPQIIIEMCGNNIQRVVTSSNLRGLHPRSVLTSLRLLYEMGEVFRAEMTKYGPNHPSVTAFAEMTLVLLKSQILNHGYPPVHHLFFDTLLRYYVVLQRAPESDILVLLNAFLFHENGVQNQNNSERDKICYIFNQLMHHIKPKLSSHCNNVVMRLQALLGIGKGNSRTPRGVNFSVKNRGDLYEILGMLLAMTDHNMMRGVFEGIVHDITGAVQNDQNQGQIHENTAAVIADNLLFVTSLAKGIADAIDQTQLAPISPETSPVVPEGLFPPIQALPPSMTNQQQQQAQNNSNNNNNNNNNSNSKNGADGQQQKQTTPHQSNVRDFAQWLFEAAARGLDFPIVRERALLLLQQIINVIGVDALPFVVQVVGHTIDSSQGPNELTRSFRAFAQAVNIMRRASTEPVGQDLLPRAISKVMSLGAPSSIFNADTNVMSENAKEMLEVYKNFFSVLHAVVHTSCVSALQQPNMSSRMGDLMTFLMATLKTAPDADTVRNSINIQQRMFTHFVQSWGDMADKMHEFFFTDVFPATCEVLTRPHVNIDVKTFMVISEITNFVRDVAARTGPQTLDRLNHFFSKLGLCSESDVKQYLDRVANTINSKNQSPQALTDTKNAMKNLLEIMGRNRNGPPMNNSNNNNNTNNSNQQQQGGVGGGGQGSGMNTPAGSFYDAGQPPQ